MILSCRVAQASFVTSILALVLCLVRLVAMSASLILASYRDSHSVDGQSGDAIAANTGVWDIDGKFERQNRQYLLVPTDGNEISRCRE